MQTGQTVKIKQKIVSSGLVRQRIKKLYKSVLPYVVLSWCESLNELHAAREINATHMGAQLERKNCI